MFDEHTFDPNANLGRWNGGLQTKKKKLHEALIIFIDELSHDFFKQIDKSENR